MIKINPRIIRIVAVPISTQYCMDSGMACDIAPRVTPSARQARAVPRIKAVVRKATFTPFFLPHYKGSQHQPGMAARVNAVDEAKDETALQGNPENTIKLHDFASCFLKFNKSCVT